MSPLGEVIQFPSHLSPDVSAQGTGGMTSDVSSVNTSSSSSAGPPYIAELRELGQWLYDIGFILDWSTTAPPPASVMVAFVHAVSENDDLTFQEAFDFVKEECGWEDWAGA